MPGELGHAVAGQEVIEEGLVPGREARPLLPARSAGSVSPGWAAVVSYFAGRSRSTPYGLPLTCSSIQARSISSVRGLWPVAPRTPKPPALVTAATTSRQWLKAKIGNSIPSRSQTSVRMNTRLC